MKAQITHPLFRNSSEVQRALEILNAVANLEVIVTAGGVQVSRSHVDISGDSASITIPTLEQASIDLSAYELSAPQILTWGSTTTVDLSGSQRKALLVQGGITTMAFTGIAAGGCMELLIKGSGNALSFPAGVNVTNTTTTTYPQSGRLSRVDIACFGTAASDVYVRTFY